MPTPLAEHIEPERVLQRLSLPSFPAPDMSGLRQLMLAFKRAVPFENLDPLSGRIVTSELGAVVDKVIVQGRGGWCFELNQLFREILNLSGFDTRLRLARVSYRRPAPGPLTHTLMTVALDGQTWLVDVGFGGPSAAEPLPWGATEHLCEDGSPFRQHWLPSGDLEVLRHIEGDWQRLYQVVPMAIQAIDLEMGSQFLSRWEPSPFRRMLMCVGFDGSHHWCTEGNAIVQRDLQWHETGRQTIHDMETLRRYVHERLKTKASDDLVSNAWDRWQAAQAGH